MFCQSYFCYTYLGMKCFINDTNSLFDSYDLFSGSGIKKIHAGILSKYPDLSEDDSKEIDEYPDRFDDYCGVYGDKPAKHGLPSIPESGPIKSEADKYVEICKKEFPEIDETHILELLSTICRLTNR